MNTPAPARPSFAALRHPAFRTYVIAATLAMMADNIEHVISYWVLHQKFHSPALGAFAVISHWVPFLLLSGYTGALADRYNPRRQMIVGMLLFMSVSVAWGLLFLGGHLQIWQAWTLLVVHGLAGVLWTPAAQVLVYDLVGAEHLQSAVRLNSSGRYLGMLAGPVVGNILLLGLGPVYGIIANALAYLPLVVWLSGGLKAAHLPVRAARTIGAGGYWSNALATLRGVVGNRAIIAMILLAGAASLFIGNAYQAQMPGFAEDLGLHNAGIAYAALLGADAAGAIGAVLLLEGRGLLTATPGRALLLAVLWCVAIAGFALSHGLLLTLPLLFAAGFFELAFSAMAQTIVQLRSPIDQRGRVIGVFITASLGLRAFSGVTVGLGATQVGIHYSLALSAAALLACIALLALWFNAKNST
jgi:MFS family permease